MFNSRVLRRRIAAVVARPPPPKQLHHWMAIMPPLAAQEAASAAAAAATAEEAAGAAEFPNCAGTGGNEPFDLCLGLLGSPKAGVSSLLHCLSTNHDVKSVDAVPRYKSVLLTIQLRLDVRGSKAESDSTSASESDESPSHTTSAGYSSSPTGPRTLRVLFVDLGALVSPMKRIWFWYEPAFALLLYWAAISLRDTKCVGGAESSGGDEKQNCKNCMLASSYCHVDSGLTFASQASRELYAHRTCCHGRVSQQWL